MSKVGHQVSDRQVAANQSNAQKSTGPKTPAGKARASLNAIKHGAYAKADNLRRQLLRTRGEDPAEYEQLQQDLVDSCQPDDALQAMVVKTIGDKTWEKLQLRRALLDRQLGSLQLARVRLERRQHSARRGLPVDTHYGMNQGLCGSKDSASKFKQILAHLDRLQEWCEEETCPEELPQVLATLYGEFPTLAGHQIRQGFIQLFGEDDAKHEKARKELPKWIAKEKSDVREEGELYQRELALRGYDRPSMLEEEVAAKEAALERQMAEQTRLLLQLKSKRSLWATELEVEGTEVSAMKEALRGPQDGLGLSEGVSEKSGQNGRTKPLEVVESTT